MKRLLFAAAVVAAPFVGQGIAAADIIPTQETECADDQAVSVTTWVNPFGFAATVNLNSTVFVVAPFTTVTRTDPWVGLEVPYTVTFAGVPGYVQEGTVATPNLIEPCTIPGTTTTVPVPSTTVGNPTIPPAVPVTEPPTVENPAPAKPIIDRSVNTCGSPWERPEDCQSTETVELAFTGTDPALLALIGAYLIAAGGIAVTWARGRRS